MLRATYSLGMTPPAPFRNTALEPLLDQLHLDFVPADPQPSWIRLVVATLVAVVGSLVADGLLVALGKHVFPSTADYPHFQFADYSKLTIIGVLIACAGWPVVTRISSTPRWVYVRLAVLTTLVLFLPDLWIWLQGQPAKGVFVLLWLHVAIAIVTYHAVVRIAPAGQSRMSEASTGRDRSHENS